MLLRSVVGGLAALLVLAAGAPAAPPVLTLPGDLTAEAQGAGGAVVTFAATATNTGGNPVAVTCAPAAGSTFPLGATVVTCATDDASVSGTFTVTVVDTSPPAVSGSVSASVEAVGSSGTPVTFASPTAVDLVDGPVPVTCKPGSGSTFPLGTTAVACSATDAHGNTATSPGAITVLDTTPPTLTVPAGITIGATSPAGVSASDARVAAFVAGATATDIVTERPTVTTDVPGLLPVGATTVTFTATDSSGNHVSATSTITVSAPPATAGPTPPPPPSPPRSAPTSPSTPPATARPGVADRTPPADVTAVRATPGSRTVSIRWTAPSDPDFSHVRVLRTVATEPAASAIVVYEGNATTLRDAGLRNGTQYRYVIVSFDRTGNRSAGVAFAVQPRAILLWAPKDGARVVRPPLLVWARVAAATYYNVQLFRGRTKILTAWPTRTQLKLGTTWRYAGRLQRLSPGTYRWYVWPGIGARRDATYGAVLGASAFTVAAR